MRELLSLAAERAARYLESLPDRRVSPSAEAIAALDGFDVPLPDGPTSPESIIDQLDRLGSPATMAMAGPRFFGFVIGGSLPAALAANWLASAWDQNSFSAVSSPAASVVEEIACGWLLELLGLPRESGIGLTTGAQMANVTGLAAARHALLARAGWDVEEQGLAGAPPLRVFAGGEAHVTLWRALRLLGIGRAQIEVVPADDQGAMRADALHLDGPAIVCAQAGNVNSGACDPLAEITAAASEHGAWVHVDGAFGLWATASPALRGLVAGAGDADSWATDGHKWLNVPYDSGYAFCAHPDSHAAAIRRARVQQRWTRSATPVRPSERSAA